MKKNVFKNRVVLITGGTGSLGKRLLERIKGAKEVRIFSRSELGQDPLRLKYPKVKFIRGDVADYRAIRGAVKGVDVVIHAAGFKFLDLAESQARQCVLSNVIGSMRLIDAVLDEKTVKLCVGVSTDKVAYARNVYGCTKHIMEKLFREANLLSKTKFFCVRYGNVLGTTGSVLTIWEKQLKENKPLTVTNKEMTRFFFELDDAVNLIFYSLSYAKGGEVFAAKMSAKRIYDMAVEFSKGKVPIVVTGMRLGEKLHETLIADYEGDIYSSEMAVGKRKRGHLIIKK